MATYTVFAKWVHETDPEMDVVEELDVEAVSHDDARGRAIRDLKADYEPGWTIVHIERREGLFL